MDAKRERVLAVLDVASDLAERSSDAGRRARADLMATTGLSAPGVELALGEHLETSATEAELASLFACVGAATRCHVILSANVCTAACRAIGLATATAERVVVRPSRRDPGLAPLFVRHLQASRRFARAGGSIELAATIDAAPGDEVHAYGSDESLRTIAAALPAGAVLRGHGTGIGLAVVSSTDDLSAAAAALASDIVPFDQRGCLSPRIALVVGDAGRGRRLSKLLGEALSRSAQRIPRGPLDATARGELATFRALAASLGELEEQGDHLVAFFPDAPPAPLPPASRAISVACVEQAVVAECLVAPFHRFLTTIGGELCDDATRFLGTLGGVRIARLGSMQRPPFDGPVDRRERVDRRSERKESSG